MAPPPKKTQLNREDLKDAPKWVDKVLEVLNPFIQAVVAALSRGLTLQENMASQVKTVVFTTGSAIGDSFPLAFRSELSAPYACWLAQCIPLESSGSVSGGVSIHTWKLTTSGMVEVSYLSGLQANTKYRCTFIIL